MYGLIRSTMVVRLLKLRMEGFFVIIVSGVFKEGAKAPPTPKQTRRKNNNHEKAVLVVQKIVMSQ